MNVNNVFLEVTAVGKAGFPVAGLPEVAFVGRSNVGKSTLINVLINRKSMARTSQSPGKTRTINFYNVEQKLLFADLPGYGYAKVSKSESAKWGAMAEGYLKGRDAIRVIMLLLDIRRDVSQNDLDMVKFLEYYGHNVLFILTKSDKESRQGVKQRARIISGQLNKDITDFFPFSGLNRQGKDEIWDKLERSVGIYS